MNTELLWVALATYGLIMLAISPRAREFGTFFSGRNESGQAVGLGMLVGSVVISWLFAKSITNAANLGAKFGLVGSVAYAGWYVSIPVAGLVIYALRERLGVRSLGEFITGKYGRAATAAFTLVIMIRLFNEVWSNSAVVGAYFGEARSGGYYAGALVFTAVTLVYSLRGGLRSSILTDGIQFAIAIFLLLFVLGLIIPESGAAAILTSGEWTMVGGVDLLLVGLLQSLSYPFHDPVLTDRAFITDAKSMLKGYLVSGLIAGGFIVVFGFVGIHGHLAGIEIGEDAPLRVAAAFGVATLGVMSVIMMVSAGSTLDSTLSSFAKAFVVDFGGVQEDGTTEPVVARLTRRLAGADTVKVGRITMVVTVVLGTLPLFAGAAILKATTISGTMVLGLAPIFLLFAWKAAGPLAFHFALWPGVVLGIVYAAGQVPESWVIGGGSYGALLGANVWGTVIVFAGFVIGAFLDSRRSRSRATSVAALVVVGAMCVATAAWAQSAPPSEEDASGPALPSTEKPVFKGIHFSGQTMLRLTTRLDDLERPSAEVYNVRLVGKASYGDFSFLVEPRFRQSNLRSFSPSNVWLQQGFTRYDSPLEGLSISAGLLYNQLGLFWDGSWFGNLPYLNGHKLDPDMNLETAFERDWGVLGVKSWLQLSPSADGQDGAFYTPAKAALLRMEPDPETNLGHREALSARARVVGVVNAGPLTIEPGGSAQYSVIDRVEMTTDEGEIIEAATGQQSVVGAELTLRLWQLRLSGEYLREDVSQDFVGETLSRDYLLAAAGVDIIDRDAEWVRKLSLNSSVQSTRYEPEDLSETFLTAQVHLRLNRLIGFTTEYVNWRIPRLEDDATILNRIEWILHVYY